MARTQTTVQLTDELVRRLDAEAARRGTSRSRIIRTAIEELLTASSSERMAAERLVGAYRAVPPAAPDEWGELSHAGDLATIETMQRLDAEEAGAGLAPW